MAMDPIIRPLEIDRLREEWRRAEPFPHIKIDDFLDPELAEDVYRAYPSFDEALGQGRSFDFVNEQKKVQVCDASKFPSAVKRLSDAIASPEFLGALSQITGIPNLIADPELQGGGIHVTGPQGRLDVHVDFNFIEERAWHRRINILIYLNPGWKEEWGGHVELWSDGVKRLHHSFRPVLGRCVIFETSEKSYHGVSAVECPPHVSRRSFAAYYYTKEPPAGWNGKKHSTIFRARPDEVVRGWVLMPAEKVQRTLQQQAQRAKRLVGRLIRG
jgi:Rps23 Pro-64 3,4-dihydroxylase Tpa1-like proline 4-hydroxylase